MTEKPQTRKKIRHIRRSFISEEEYRDISDKSSAAKYFLGHERFQFIREYMNSGSKSALDKIVLNEITEVHEVRTITDSLKKIFITPKKPQVDELRGAYKWIIKFFEDMQMYADLRAKLDDDVEKGRVVIK